MWSFAVNLRSFAAHISDRDRTATAGGNCDHDRTATAGGKCDRDRTAPHAVMYIVTAPPRGLR